MFGTRRGQGDASFNWDPECKYPACEGGVRRDFGAPYGWLLQLAGSGRAASPQDYCHLFSSLGLLLRFFIFYGLSPLVCTSAELICVFRRIFVNYKALLFRS